MKKIILLILVLFVFSLIFASASSHIANACSNYDQMDKQSFSTTNTYPYVWHTFYLCQGYLINRDQTHWIPHNGSYAQWWTLDTFAGYSSNNTSSNIIEQYVVNISTGGNQYMNRFESCYTPPGRYLSVDYPIVNDANGSVILRDKGAWYSVAWETFLDDASSQLMTQDIQPVW